MKRILSIKNVPGILFFCGGVAVAQNVNRLAGDGTAPPAIRQAGTALDTSVRNEVDNAKRLAADWLIAQQRPDGSWGGTNAVALTAIAWLALTGVGDAVDAVARDRAMVWLDSQPVRSVPSVEAFAWRLLVISLALPDSPEKRSRIQEITTCAAVLPPEEKRDSWIWREALALSIGLKDRDLRDKVQKELAAFAVVYSPAMRDSETLWRIARIINLHAKGVLLRGTESLDWRNDFGLVLINTQRKAPEGGGYWDAKTDDTKLRATAFALLALHEVK